MKKIFIFMSFYISLFIIVCVYSQDRIITGTDDGYLEADYKIESSNVLHDKTKMNYNPEQAYDGIDNTAWCVGDSGIGEWIKFYFRPGSPEVNEILKGKRNLYRILIKNGLTVNKLLYFSNNRIKKLKIELDSGKNKTILLKDGILDFQSFIINERTKWVKVIILEIYKGEKYNDTCISDFSFREIYDITQDEYNEYIKK